MFDLVVVAENGFHAVKWHVESFNLRYYTPIFLQKQFLASQLLRALKIKLLPAAMFDTVVVAENGFHSVKWHVKHFNLRYYTPIFCQKNFLHHSYSGRKKSNFSRLAFLNQWSQRPVVFS